MLIIIALVSLAMGIFVHRQRRTRTLDRMVIDQEITMHSAEANFLNAALVREVAEYTFQEFMQKHFGQGAEVALSDASEPPGSQDQPHSLKNDEATLADLEKRLSRMLERLDSGSYVLAAPVAPTDAQAALRQYAKTLQNHVVATRARQLTRAQGSLEQTRTTLQRKIDEARWQERFKKMILSYEKAYLKCLKRDRARLWW
jgi:hypothetical protein